MITFIIANKNRRNFVTECLGSYLSLNISKELVVIDSESTDGSFEILANHADIQISEKDNSVYEAWNKGIKVARGEWICFLNTDDELKAIGMDRIYDKLENLSTKIVNFKVEVRNQSNNRVIRKKTKYNFKQIISSPVYFNGFIFHRTVFDQVGLFNSEFRNCSDQDFLWRCLDAGIRSTFVDEVAYIYLQHQDSLTMSSSKTFFREELIIAERNQSQSKSKTGKRYSNTWVAWETVSLKYESNKIMRVIARLFHPQTKFLQIQRIFRAIF